MTPFTGTHAADIRDLVSSLNDEKVILIDSATWGIKGGADSLHPNEDSHRIVAEKLYAAIMKALNGDSTVPTPTPDPTKRVVNGDAEDSSMAGWGIFSQAGGTVTQVTPGANGTGHAMKFTPGGGKYDSISFDLGPAIVDDPANNYKGDGAAEYTLTFWARADAGCEGDFTVVINSQYHQNKANGLTATYISLGTQIITLTEEWEEYKVTFTIAEDYLNTIKKYYAEGKTEAYELILRLDGSPAGCAFADGETFSYYIDEVVIVGPKTDSADPANGGDVLPVALIASAATAAVALTVIAAKKRKEQE